MFKKITTGIFLASSLVFGVSAVSQADINNDPFIKLSSDGATVNWTVRYDYGFHSPSPTFYRIYMSPALSDKDYFENKKVTYKKVADIMDGDYTDSEEGWESYEYELPDLKDNKIYRFKIEAYDRDNLLCTDYCDNTEAIGDLYLNDLKVKETAGGKVTLSWDKKSLNKEKVKVYLSDPLTNCNEDPGNIHSKKLGEVSAKSGRFTIKGVKPGKEYYYSLVVSKGKKIIDIRFGRIGKNLKTPELHDYNKKTPYFDTDLIKVPFYAPEGTDGLIVYRKEAGGKYVKAGSVKKKKNYIDKDVEAGKTYTYKARTYKKINGKTIYSLYSDEVTISAVNKEAKINVSFDEKDKSIMKIESADKNNGTISLMYFGFKDDYEDYNVVQYSLDGINWTDNNYDIPALKAGETIYLKFNKGLSRESVKIGSYVYYGEGPIWMRTYDIIIDTVNNTGTLLLDKDY